MLYEVITWSPVVHLSCHAGSRPIWNDEIIGFVPGPTVQEAALKMSQAGISSVLIVNPNQHSLAGIITDRDLRNRVV